MSSTTMTVALVLTAMNNMGPNINSARRMISGLSTNIEDAQRKLQKYQELRDSGMNHLRGAAVMAIPLEESIRNATKFESVMKNVELANYDSTVPLNLQEEQLEKLSELALQLGADTAFNNTEAAQAQRALLRNGMEYEDVMTGGAKASMYLAQTAEIAATAAADAVSQITNMFQLNGSQLMQVADDINRAANASSAEVQAIMHDMQQVGGTAHIMGLQAKETTLLLGTLHNMGLGDSSGNYLNDMLINLDKVTPKAQKALYSMGWLKDAQVSYTKTGKMQISGGENSLFDERGQLRSAQHLVNSLRAALAGVNLEGLYNANGELLPAEEIDQLIESSNKLQVLQNFKDVFGIQGMRAAIALAQNGKGSYEEMVQKAERMKAIDEQVAEMQGTLAGMFESLMGSWETLMTSSGSPMIDEMKSFVKWATNTTNAVMEWTKANPEATRAILRLVGGMALIRGSMGLFNVIRGFFGPILIFLSNFASKAQGLYTAFKYFRQGNGIFRALWSAIAFGHPLLTKVGNVLGGFGKKALTVGAQALLAGARIALAWLIGLGPVGWIILGVTAAIAAGVAAWKTNFGGFRDWVISWASKVVDVINKVRTAFGKDPVHFNWMDKPSIGDFKAQEYQKPQVLSNSGGNDNRKYEFNIQSTDPKGAAREVHNLLGGSVLDKYQLSRDPRLQDPVLVK
ncbi:phage tail tape measure protein [Desulforamulus ruminis]|uniref:Phage tail tape measure protein, TP901 family n=1 Tax=Desulforamulus ruminis (strain ATCC 23193 / DSM 2154 / NCIMB 8452 / DL) TaxID=696281 RepID=F6DTF2_DESRL|nr:phage tail tape measure protein [Desulforamulus ruminis]AEG60014.1 phage tail tape measure protein, TP901 family [Desulforamulus ruminis DSM 2154]